MKYDSSSDSSSGSDSDVESVEQVLEDVGLHKKYKKLFSKAEIDDIDDLRQLNDKRLKKLGITSSTDRKKILKAIQDADDGSSGSESESDSDSGSEEEGSASDDSDSTSATSEQDLSTLETVLTKAKVKDAKKYVERLRQRNVKSLKTAKKLSDSQLKNWKITSSPEVRARLLKAFKDVSSKEEEGRRKKGGSKASTGSRGSNNSKSSKKSGGSGSSKDKKRQLKEDGEKKVIYRRLKKAGYENVALKFEEKGITTLEKARDLSPSKLKSMGVDTLSSRMAVMNAFHSSASEDESESEAEEKVKDPIKATLLSVDMGKHYKLFCDRGVTSVRQAQELGHNELRDMGIENLGQREIILEAFAIADWKCIYCSTWNENRKTCIVCQKTHRRMTQNPEKADSAGLELQQRVKYIGKFRPTTRLKYGEKGEIHRVLADGFYMVKFVQKDKKNSNNKA